MSPAGGHLLVAHQTITTVASSPASAREVTERMPCALAGNQRDHVFHRKGPRHSQLAVPQRPTLLESSLTANTTGRIVQPPARLCGRQTVLVRPLHPTQRSHRTRPRGLV